MFLLEKNQEWCDNVPWSKSSRQIRLVDWGWQSTVSGNQPEPLAFLEGACGNLKVRQLTKIRILSRLLGQTIDRATTHKPKQFSLERYLNNSGRERGTAHSYCQCSHSTAKIQVRLNCTIDNLYCPKTAGWIKEQKNNFPSPKQKIYIIFSSHPLPNKWIERWSLKQGTRTACWKKSSIVFSSCLCEVNRRTDFYCGKCPTRIFCIHFWLTAVVIRELSAAQ